MPPWNPNAAGSTSQQDNAETASPAQVTVVASAARTGGGQSSTQQAGSYRTLNVLLSVTAVSGTTPTLDLSIQWSHDGTTWHAGQPADAFTQVTSTQAVARQFAVKAPLYRLVWGIAGTTPSFTFGVVANLIG